MAFTGTLFFTYRFTMGVVERAFTKNSRKAVT